VTRQVRACDGLGENAPFQYLDRGAVIGTENGEA
jgi:hypothetical protein